MKKQLKEGDKIWLSGGPEFDGVFAAIVCAPDPNCSETCIPLKSPKPDAKLNSFFWPKELIFSKRDEAIKYESEKISKLIKECEKSIKQIKKELLQPLEVRRNVLGHVLHSFLEPPKD